MVGIRKRLLLLLVFLPVWASHAVAEGESANESALLKAAYIYNFAKFTRWEQMPEEDVLHLCVLGRDSLSDPLQHLAGKWVGERHISVNMLSHLHDAECHIIYFSASQQAHYRSQLQGLAGQPLLTISELSGFAVDGGMIELFEEQGRIRFRVNLEAVEAGGLTLSSRMLNLAEIVGGEAR